MRDLAAMGVGEPYVRGTARNHLLRLGWIEGVLKLADGRQMSTSEIDATYGKGSEEWRGARFVGVTLTNAGRLELAKHHPTDTGSVT